MLLPFSFSLLSGWIMDLWILEYEMICLSADAYSVRWYIEFDEFDLISSDITTIYLPFVIFIL